MKTIIPLLQGATQKPRARMYESYILASCEDYNILQVTTPTTSNPKSFIASEKESLFLPKEMPSIQIDYTTYYYTSQSDLPGMASVTWFVFIVMSDCVYDCEETHGICSSGKHTGARDTIPTILKSKSGCKMWYFFSILAPPSSPL